MTSPVTFSLHKVTIISNTLAYATGPGGAIKYEDLTGIEGQSIHAASFILDQNYPNPFNPSTSIQYAIGSKQFVQLRVYDLLVKKLQLL